MPEDYENLPLASHERTLDAERIFGEYLVMSPGEWAARYSHIIGCSSFGDYRYLDVGFSTWIHEVHRILRSPEAIRWERESHLTAGEIGKLHELESDPNREL